MTEELIRLTPFFICLAGIFSYLGFICGRKMERNSWLEKKLNNLSDSPLSSWFHSLPTGEIYRIITNSEWLHLNREGKKKEKETKKNNLFS